MSTTKTAGLESSSLPSQFKPSGPSSELRKSGRIEFRYEQRVAVDIEIDEEIVTGFVLDISSTGLCCAIEKSLAEKIKPLTVVTFSAHLPDGQTSVGKATICWTAPFRGENIRLGLRTEELPALEDADKLLEIPASYPLSGFLYKKHVYSEKSVFNVEALSRSLVKIVLFDSRLLLFPNMQIEIKLNLAQEQTKISCQVVSIHPKDKNHVEAVLSILSLSPEIERPLIDHLIQNAQLTPEHIRQAGFKVKDIADNFAFSFVRTHEEYMRVLELRLDAYKNAGKVASDKKPSDMVAPLDYISRIIFVTHANKVIASAAISFPETNDLVLDTERALPGGFPEKMPAKVDCVEVSRLCIDTQYRRGDLLSRVFEHIYRIFASSGRKHIVTSTDDKLWPIYRALGFYKTGLVYAHPYLKGLPHEIILIDIATPTVSRSISLPRWSALYKKMTLFMLSQNEFHYTRAGRWKLRFLLWKEKFLRLFTSR